MGILSSIRQGSFNGARFKLPASTTTTFGRKTVTHEFINSNRREVEDLGRLNRTFQIIGLIDNVNNNYFNDRDTLMAVLESNLPGILVHPFYGSILVKPTTHTVVETINNLSVAEFSMNFLSVFPVIFPVRAITLLPQLTDIFNRMTGNIVNNFVSGFSVGDFNITNSTDAVSKVNSVGGAMSESISVAGGDANQLEAARFEENIATYNAAAFQLTKNPGTLAQSTLNLLDDANSLGQSTQTKLDVAQSLFGFGEDDVPVPDNTDIRRERLTNRGLINDTINVIALMNSYIDSASKQYTSIGDLNNDIQIFEAQYDTITDSARFLSSQIISDLDSARSIANQNFSTLSINLNQRETVSTPTIPYAALFYQYNGNLNDFRQALAENGPVDAGFVEGQVLV